MNETLTAVLALVNRYAGAPPQDDAERKLIEDLIEIPEVRAHLVLDESGKFDWIFA